MLSNKQVKFLKSMGHELKAVYQVGKDGVTSNLVEDVLNYLNKHELVKVRLLQNCEQCNDEAKQIFEEANIEVVQSIGSILLLFKQNKKLKNSIVLP